MAIVESSARFDAMSLLSPAVGGCALLLIGSPPVSITLAIVAVALALASRRRLRRSGSLRGARAGVLGFILGGTAITMACLPWVISYVLFGLDKLS